MNKPSEYRKNCLCAICCKYTQYLADKRAKNAAKKSAIVSIPTVKEKKMETRKAKYTLKPSQTEAGMIVKRYTTDGSEKRYLVLGRSTGKWLQCQGIDLAKVGGPFLVVVYSFSEKRVKVLNTGFTDAWDSGDLYKVSSWAIQPTK